MQWHDYLIFGELCAVLEISNLDEEDIRRAPCAYRCQERVQLSLSDLEMLAYFDKINTLVLTEGLQTERGTKMLYECKGLTRLVLHYEETDSDEEGIILAHFPKLEYVMSLSNLNIRYEALCPSEIKAEIWNRYKDGKCICRKYDGGNSPLRPPRTIFFSTEAEAPAGAMIIRILSQYQRKITQRMGTQAYSTNLRTIGIIPSCVSPRMLAQGFWKERKYVNLKKGYADIRLMIDYAAFGRADHCERIMLCRDCILRSAAYIQEKDPSFQGSRFTTDVEIITQELLKKG